MKKNWYLLAVLVILVAWLLQAATLLPLTGAIPMPFAPELAAPLQALCTLDLLPF
ncbi:hypothetical protein [Flaviaesturariibacter amylovorans]|uniref:Uncharacterized protein n=1 Tax=Flaviaesturariibacter amylovorans TaxID=1084520 RepID=A0ABP8HSZ8_9BACT